MLYSDHTKCELIDLMNDAARADNWHLWGYFHDIFKEMFGYNPFCDEKTTPCAICVREKAQ